MHRYPDKFQQLILYICARCGEHPHFGLTKLNKLLFMVDFQSYFENGQSVTGAEYVKLPFGPAPRSMKTALKDMVENRDIEIREALTYTHIEKRPIARRQPTTEVFSSKELEIAERWIEKFQNLPAKEIVEISHRYIGWMLVSEGEVIPYSSVYWRITDPSEITPEDLEICRAISARHGPSSSS